MHIDPARPLDRHVRVDEPDAAVEGREVLIAPNTPSPGIRVAFIVENGTPVQQLEARGAAPAWNDDQ